MAGFPDSIVDVVFACAKEKMARVYARFHIAFVKNMITVFNISVVNDPRNTMSFRGGIFCSKLPISVIKPASHPNPASRCLIDILKETFHNGFSHQKPLYLLFLASLLSFAGAYNAHAADTPQVQAFGPFAGLNTNSDPKAISASQSPDLLNVDIGNNGTSVKKRQGYGLDVTLSLSTGPVHNMYKFFDSSGNEIRLAFNDIKVNASVNGGAWSVILSTGLTAGATWGCTDYLGFAYCTSSAFDCPLKTNGTSVGTTGVCGTNMVPQGSLIASTADRLLVGATSTNPSRLYYSQSTVLTNFTLGIQPSDSSFEDITSPGSKLTHLAYRFGRWLWWKEQSFGFLIGTGQFDLNSVVVSNTIGTLDDTDVFDGNFLYFRGSDAQIYTYDGSVLSRSISADISPTLRTANRRKAGIWTQTTQADFAAGTIKPTGWLSTSLSPGDVVTSSFSASEYSTTSGWSSGTASSTTIVGTSSITLNTNNTNILNNGFESGTNNWTLPVMSVVGATANKNCTTNPRTGSAFGRNFLISCFTGQTVRLQTCGGTNLTSTAYAWVDNSCSWTSRSLSASGQTGKAVRISIECTDDGIVDATSDCFIASGNNITFYTQSDTGRSSFPQGQAYAYDDFTDGRSSLGGGSFTSQIYNTGFTSNTVTAQAVWTVNTSTPAFAVLTASNVNTGPWATILTSTGTNASGFQYLKYVSTITATESLGALTYISSVTVIARSTGTYYSVVNNAPNLTSFSTLGITDSVGNSTITYYVRTSTASFTVLSSTPNWIAQSKNSTVNYSTGTYMQLRADFSITAATENPTLSDFTFNWYEGSASDKMYGTYFNNAIWFSLSLGTSTTTNNRIFRYDLLSNVWTLYDIASNGFLTYNNNLYFGDPAAGKVYQFGNNVYADNGVNISAYWKSKPFFGDSPFNEKDLRMGSWFVAAASGTTLTVTYTLDESTNTVTKNINLYSSTKGMIRNNYNFPAGTAPTVFSAKVSDNSSNLPWEVFGGLVTFVPRPPIVTP